jgi:hypothetical protein
MMPGLSLFPALFLSLTLALPALAQTGPRIGEIDVMPDTGIYAVSFHAPDAALDAALAERPSEALAHCLTDPVVLQPGGAVLTLSRQDTGFAVATRARCEQSGPVVFCDTGRRYAVEDGGAAGFGLRAPDRLRVFHACLGGAGLVEDAEVARALRQGVARVTD